MSVDQNRVQSLVDVFYLKCNKLIAEVEKQPTVGQQIRFLQKVQNQSEKACSLYAGFLIAILTYKDMIKCRADSDKLLSGMSNKKHRKDLKALLSYIEQKLDNHMECKEDRGSALKWIGVSYIASDEYNRGNKYINRAIKLGSSNAENYRRKMEDWYFAGFIPVEDLPSQPQREILVRQPRVLHATKAASKSAPILSKHVSPHPNGVKVVPKITVDPISPIKDNGEPMTPRLPIKKRLLDLNVKGSSDSEPKRQVLEMPIDPPKFFGETFMLQSNAPEPAEPSLTSSNDQGSPPSPPQSPSSKVITLTLRRRKSHQDTIKELTRKSTTDFDAYKYAIQYAKWNVNDHMVDCILDENILSVIQDHVSKMSARNLLVEFNDLGRSVSLFTLLEFLMENHISVCRLIMYNLVLCETAIGHFLFSLSREYTWNSIKRPVKSFSNSVNQERKRSIGIWKHDVITVQNYKKILNTHGVYHVDKTMDRILKLEKEIT